MPVRRARLENVKAISGITCGLLFVSLFSALADEAVNLAGEPPAAPMDLSEAHGRLDVEYLLIPETKLGAFRDSFDQTGVTPDLSEILKESGGKVVASASTGLRLGGDGTMLEMAESRLTLRPRIAAPNQFHLDGRITRSTFSGTFDVLLQPGQYQLFVLWDQPPHGGVKDPYNAIVACMREISVESPGGEVRVLTARPGPLPPQPAPGAVPPPPPALPKTGKILYENRGDNTRGFVLKHSGTGSVGFTVHDNTLIGNYDGTTNQGWWALPVFVTQDFRIDFDVYSDANDACSFAMLFDDATNQGINLANSTNTSYGTHSIYINSVRDLTDHQQIYYDHTVLASAESTAFPNQVWTHVTIAKKGHTLTDNVGGQIISVDLPDGFLPAKTHVGLGYYATKNVGGNGQIRYANIGIVQTESR